VAAFEGDLFEVEDQRNWTDASFKTYCTPIGLGYPHSIQQGQKIRQLVTLTTQGPGASYTVRPTSNGRAEVEAASVAEGSWPQLGLGSGPTGAVVALPRDQRRRLRALALDHLRLDLRISDGTWASTLDRAFADADALGCRLEVALFAGESSVGELAQAALRLGDPRVVRVIALHEPTAGTAVTPQPWFQTVEQALTSGPNPRPLLFTGTDGDFAELNRDRPAPGAAGVAFALNPQVHSSDDQSILETVPIHGSTVVTARSFATGLVAVSPITLRGRFNPAAAEPHGTTVAEPPADARQSSLLAAAWTLGSFASLVHAQADSVTYFETVGARGILGQRSDDPTAAIPPDTVFPVWFVLADLADRAGWLPARLVTQPGAAVTGVALRRPGALRVLLANLGTDTVRVRVGPWDSGGVRVRNLDANTAGEAMAGPSRFLTSGQWRAPAGGRLDLELTPYAYARLDSRERDGPEERAFEVAGRRRPRQGFGA
jgi:D-apionolactonase